MKELKLIDRVVVEIKGDDNASIWNVAEQLRRIADMIEDGIEGGKYYPNEDTELLWEREHPENGGFRMGNRSLICDAYYGAKQTFEVCCVEREDLENRDFDTSELTNEDMQRIAGKAGDFILEGCDYWTGIVEAARYCGVPIKNNDSIRAHLDDILVDAETDTGGTSFHNQTLRELLEEIPTTLNELNITLDDDSSVLDDILEECGIKPIVKNNNDVQEVIPDTNGVLNESSIRE